MKNLDEVQFCTGSSDYELDSEYIRVSKLHSDLDIFPLFLRFLGSISYKNNTVNVSAPKWAIFRAISEFIM